MNAGKYTWKTHNDIIQQGTDALKKEAHKIGADTAYQIPHSWWQKLANEHKIQSKQPTVEDMTAFQEWLTTNKQHIKKETFLKTTRTQKPTGTLEPTLYGPKGKKRDPTIEDRMISDLHRSARARANAAKTPENPRAKKREKNKGFTGEPVGDEQEPLEELTKANQLLAQDIINPDYSLLESHGAEENLRDPVTRMLTRSSPVEDHSLDTTTHGRLILGKEDRKAIATKDGMIAHFHQRRCTARFGWGAQNGDRLPR